MKSSQCLQILRLIVWARYLNSIFCAVSVLESSIIIARVHRRTLDDLSIDNVDLGLLALRFGLLQLGILEHAFHCAALGISHLTKSPRAACQTFCHKPASGIAKNGNESVVGDGCALRWGALGTSPTLWGRSDSSILNKLLYVFTQNLKK